MTPRTTGDRGASASDGSINSEVRLARVAEMAAHCAFNYTGWTANLVCHLPKAA
jgi:hypothetical protein